MSTVQYGSLIYLTVLGAALLFWAIVHHRHSMGNFLQQMAAWGFIFVGFIAAYGLWGDIRRTVLPAQATFTEQGDIVLTRASDQHFYATLDVNGSPVRFVIDTGATGIVLSKTDAARAGLDPTDLVFYQEAMTANGVVRTAPVRLGSLALGPVVDVNVPAFVNEGLMDNSLLGMSYLQRFDRIEIAGDELRLQR